MSRILIVEDDPAILCGLRDNLEFESHQVFTATDGEAGYRSLRDHTPDLVILDLMLPKLNGYDLCKRARGEGFRAPILMLSARSQEADRVMSESAILALLFQVRLIREALLVTMPVVFVWTRRRMNGENVKVHIGVTDTERPPASSEQ